MAKYIRETPPSIRSWFGELGGAAAALVLAIGFAMTGVVSVKVGMGLMFLGIVWLLVDSCLKFRKSRPTCVVATIVSIAVYGFFWWLIYIPAPLAFTVINPPNNYPVGTTVLGVPWKPEYHPVRVIIANETGH